MYEVFYNLKAEPFRLSPDHKFCFEHKGYAKARAYMFYAFKRAEGFVMITGRPGTGKTTLIGELVESLSRDKVFTANLVCTQLQADDLLKTVAYSFGVGAAKVDKAELLQRLTVLFHRWHREGRRALLIVDEAQDLSASAMEELRLLTNIEIGGQPLLQIFLLGQPELRDLILSPELEQVHQRIVAASHIEALEADETEAYVIHRLQAVGWKGDPALDRAIFPLIHKFSEGVPRRINLICSRLFLLGSVEQRHAIELNDVRVVIGELQAENLAAGSGFSSDDFQTETPSEWVRVPDAALQTQPENHLHAVTVEIDKPIDGETESASVTALAAKKKASPDLNLAPNSAAPINSSTADDFNDSGARFEVELARDNNSGSISNDLHGVHYARSSELDAGRRNSTHSAALAAVSGPRWMRIVVRSFVLILAICLIVLLKDCFARRDDWSYQDQNWLQEDVHDGLPNDLKGDLQKNVPEKISQTMAGTLSTVAEASTPLAANDQLSETPAPSAANPVPSTPSPVLSTLSPVIESGGDAIDAATAANESQLPQLAEQSAVSEPVPVQSSQIAESEESNERASPSLRSDDDVAPALNEAANSEQPGHTLLVRFLFDSDALLPESHDALDKVAKNLLEQPGHTASITGFADSHGDERYNLVLSQKRADAVEQYLVAAGVDPLRLHVEGRGVLTTSTESTINDPAVTRRLSRVVQITLNAKDFQ